MVYLGLIGATIGSMLGPWLTIDASVWTFARSLIACGAGMLAMIYPRLGWAGKISVLIGVAMWTAVHRPQAETSNGQARVLFRHGSQFGSLLLVSSDGNVTTAIGSANRGELVDVRCRAKSSLFSRNVCFARSQSMSMHSIMNVAVTRLEEYGQTISRWIQATVLGRHHLLDYRTKTHFKSSGLYHLLVVSGFHVSLIASLLRLVCLAPVWPLYCSRLMSPRIWQLSYRSIKWVVLPLVWSFAWLTGLGCPAQRAAICYTLKCLGVRKGRIAVGLLLQAILFPCGWLGLSNAMSWFCYFILISLSGGSFRNLVSQVVAITFGAWGVLGVFTPVGILTNLFLAPWMVLLISVGVFMPIVDPTSQFVVYYRTAIIATEQFLASVSELSPSLNWDFGWGRWLILSGAMIFLVRSMKPCKEAEKLLS